MRAAAILAAAGESWAAHISVVVRAAGLAVATAVAAATIAVAVATIAVLAVAIIAVAAVAIIAVAAAIIAAVTMAGELATMASSGAHACTTPSGRASRIPIGGVDFGAGAVVLGFGLAARGGPHRLTRVGCGSLRSGYGTVRNGFGKRAIGLLAARFHAASSSSPRRHHLLRLPSLEAVLYGDLRAHGGA